jgi:hypothetical protein
MQNSELDEWCKSQERFLLQHIECLRQGRIRVHLVEDKRFIDTTDEVADNFKRQLADLRACTRGRK